MRIDQVRLRTIVAEADAARVATYPLKDKRNALMKEISDVKNALDPHYRVFGQDGPKPHPRFSENEKERSKLRAELNVLIKRVDDLEIEIDGLQAEAASLNQLAEAGRDLARSLGQLPAELERQ